MTLLITNYWYPWNHSGTFRWVGFGRYLEFDVLTSKHRKGFYDETINTGKHRVLSVNCFGFPAVISGFILAIRSLFLRYDLYVYTSPPESLLLVAWLQQKLGRKVMVDMRDSVDYPEQPLKFLVPVYRWFAKRIKNKTVSAQFIDPDAYCVYHGYENVNVTTGVRFRDICEAHSRLSYLGFMHELRNGFRPDLTKKPKGYGSSSYMTIKHLWGDIFKGHFHPEYDTVMPESWEVQSEKMKEYMESL